MPFSGKFSYKCTILFLACHLTFMCVKMFIVAAGVMDEELRQAQEKFEESKQLAETAMQNLIENDVSIFISYVIGPCSLSAEVMILSYVLPMLTFGSFT